jgi:hypothetical protein
MYISALGAISNSIDVNAAHSEMIKAPPQKTPKQKGRLFLKPSLVELPKHMMLLGPGEKAVRKTYEKNAARFMKKYPLLTDKSKDGEDYPAAPSDTITQNRQEVYL